MVELAMRSKQGAAIKSPVQLRVKACSNIILVFKEEVGHLHSHIIPVPFRFNISGFFPCKSFQCIFYFYYKCRRVEMFMIKLFLI